MRVGSQTKKESLKELKIQLIKLYILEKFPSRGTFKNLLNTKSTRDGSQINQLKRNPSSTEVGS